jgi:hypothetical protein
MIIMKEIKRIDMKSSMKMLAAFSFLSVLIDIFFAKIIPNGSGENIGWNSILIASFVGAISFFILVLILIFIYNSLSRWIGGVKIEL